MITFTTPELPELESIPATLDNKIEITPESNAITIKGRLSTTQAQALEAVFKTEEGKEAVRMAVSRQRQPKLQRIKSPAEKGDKFKIPLLSIKQGELWEPFEETHLLQGDWRLLDYPPELSEEEFNKISMRAQGGSV